MVSFDWLNNTQQVVDMGSKSLFVVYSLLMGYFFYRLSVNFFNTQKAYIAGVVYGAFMVLNTTFPFDLPKGVGSVIRIAMGFFVLYILDRSRPRQKLFISILFYTLVTLCMQLNAEQGMYFNDFLFDVLPFNTTGERTVLLYFVGLFEDAVFFGAALGLGVFLSVKFISMYDEEISHRDLLFLTLPFLIVFSQIWVFSDYYDLYAKYFTLLDKTGDTSTLQNLSYNSVPRLFNMLLFYVFILVFVWCFFDIKRISRENVNAAILEEQTKAMQDHVKKMEDMYGRIRSIRHDINHHLEVLSALLQEGKNEEAGEYLTSMKEFTKEGKSLVSTGNPVTDIIISERAAEAKEKGIDFSSSFTYPSDFGFDIFDISGILGNAFSNAFNACEGQSEGYIAISTVIKKNIFLMEMKNSYDGQIIIDKKTGLAKREEGLLGHGIGMPNMQSIARKYNGDVTIEQKGNEVTLCVILQRQNP